MTIGEAFERFFNLISEWFGVHNDDTTEIGKTFLDLLRGVIEGIAGWFGKTF